MAADPIRRLAIPVRFVGARAVSIEQDSDADKIQRAAAVLAFRPKQRMGSPDFGCAAYAHVQNPQLDVMAQAVTRWDAGLATEAEEGGRDVLGIVQEALVLIGDDGG